MKKFTRKNHIPKSNIYKQIVRMMLHMLDTIKLYHWGTRYYSVHKSTDHVHKSLSILVDEFVEIILGKTNGDRTILNIGQLRFSRYNSKNSFISQINEYLRFLINLTDERIINTKNNSDLMSKRDEIVGELNQFVYLVRLN